MTHNIPYGDKILVRKITVPEVTSGIIFNDLEKSAGEKGEIVSIGPDTKQSELGMIVTFPQGGYTSLNIDGEKLYLIKESSIYYFTKPQLNIKDSEF